MLILSQGECEAVQACQVPFLASCLSQRMGILIKCVLGLTGHLQT